MDRQLTERMVGAALLLGALVVVVPLILDGSGQPPRSSAGPGEEPIDLRTHTIHLDGSERALPVPRPRGDPVIPVEGPLPEARSEPGEGGESVPVPAAPATPPAPEAGESPPAPLSQPQPQPPPATAPIPAGDRWYVQLGSFSSKANAERLAADARGKGFSVTVSPLEVRGGTTLFRVRAGSESSREEAAELASRLARAGFPGGQLVR